MKKLIYAFAVLLLTASSAFSQTDFTLYNMTWTPQAMYQNPALTPYSNVNIGLPVLSSIYLNVWHNSFKPGQLFRKDGDSLTIDVDNAISHMAPKLNTLSFNARIDLLSVGFRVKENNYISLSATEHVMARINFTKDMFGGLWKGNGSPDYLGNTIDFSNTGLDLAHYREYAIGYTRENILDKLNVGVRLKYIYGMENVYMPAHNSGLSTDAGDFTLTAQTDIKVNTSTIPFYFAAGEGDSMVNDSTSESLFNGNIAIPKYLFGMANHGFGVDFGFSFKIDDHWKVSGSIADAGFILNKELSHRYRVDDAAFSFSGIDPKGFLDTQNDAGEVLQDILDSLGNAASEEFQVDHSPTGYMAPTFSRFMVAGNYFFMDGKYDAGLLFTGQVYKGIFRPSATASFNARFGRTMQLSLSYSVNNREWYNVGLGMSVNAGPVQLYIISDNILGFMAPHMLYSAPDGDKPERNIPLPRFRNVHIHTGINLTFGRGKTDRDGDGIPDKKDMCPDDPGPEKYQGCPDRDEDGILDKDDICPDTPGLPEFSGCPDTDKDGLTDSLDACPLRPGPIELNGCPDRDEDGIIDDEDACPDQPGPVATQGCPDKDGDGIIDSEDLCPEKPGPKEHQGCPDTDGDGLYDNEDKCVDVFGPVDNFGCPYGDLDGDGVFDKEDRCPDTPGPRENKGCPYGDLDGDGVGDNVDECPNTPGLPENNGCPELSEEEEGILNAAFDNLEFESGKAIIRSSSYESLDSLASLLIRKPDWKLKIAGHTDNVGSDATNMNLSKNRSNSVKDYLNLRGINNESRFIVEWFGESKPLYPNETAEGRQKNRRVEMTVIFE